jgi:hypothetical protein
VTAGVASATDPHHHDPGRLAVAILRAIERDGAAVRRERTERAGGPGSAGSRSAERAARGDPSARSA